MPLSDLILFVVVLILGVVLIRLGWRLRKTKDPARKPSNELVLLLSVLAIGLSVYLIVREIQSRAPYQYDPAMDQALGRHLAGLFLPEKTGEGAVVIISQGVPQEGAVYENHISRTRLEAFIESMRQQGHAEPQVVSPLSIIRSQQGTEKAKDAHFIDDYWFIETGLPSKVLTQVWKAYPNATIFISLEGMPRGELEALRADKPAGSKLYALDLLDYEYGSVPLEKTPLNGLVVYRANPKWDSVGGDDATLFNNRYIYLQP